MMFEILDIFTGIMTSVGASLTLIIFKTIFDKKQNQQEAKEILVISGENVLPLTPYQEQ